ncbi:hypothetical protein BD626DRAFT_504099 [Schizophyllum amplum]|uniref:Uncharacterized protein n=1 Tax=Schizophyllum amplum TaxID=97359 RepID=A0A550C6Q4_9AGAR|nr:hypothetical protein BD626DRAFT_504099 [Auriculariopsis ampla]
MGCFMRQGNFTSVALALLSEMYTTTYKTKGPSPDGKPQHRLRLDYCSSPSADFGIAKGALDVTT